MVAKKTTNGTVVSQVGKVLDQELAPLSRNFPDLILEASLTNAHAFVKNFFTRKIPNLQLAGRLAYFRKNWKKLTQDQGILSIVKGYVIPFLKVPVPSTIPHQMAVSKTQELLIDQENMEMLDKGAIKSGISNPTTIPEQYSAGKKEKWGKSFMYKLKSPQQAYNIQAF